MLLLRAFVACLVLPGVFAGLLPGWIAAVDRWRGGGSPAGWGIVAAGAVLLFWCVRDFYAAGAGTLAPWDPPRRLVVIGLYRYTRNPMYLAVLTLVAGWSVLLGSPLLGGYAAVLAVGFHLRTVTYEEPHLQEAFGEEWSRYRAAVPRWLPRRSPWRG